MGNIEDTLTLYKREMLIFKSHLRTNIIRSIMFPLIIILFLGSIGSSSFGIKVAIVNYANNPESFAFMNSLVSNRAVSIQSITTQTDALNMLSGGSITAVVVILPSFPKTSNGNPSIDIYYSNSNFAATGTAIPFIEQEAASFGSGSSSQASQSANGNVSVRPLYGTASSYKVFLIGGIVGMVAAFGTVFGGGISIITDRQLGNLKSFLIAPINSISIVMSKILSGTTQSLLYIILALIIGLLDGASIAMGWVGLGWILLLGVLISLGFAGITTVIASRIEKVEVYAIVANIIVMPMWFLSGAFFPSTSLPTFMQPLATYNPMTYATQGVRDVMMIGYYPLSHMIIDLSALGAFVVVGILLSILLFKNYID
jgi:ABC-2 type transport system permease protein